MSGAVDRGKGPASHQEPSRLRQVAVYFGLADEDPAARPPEGPSEPTLTGGRAVALLLVPATALIAPLAFVGTKGALIWVGVIWLAALLVVSPLGAPLRPRYLELNQTTAVAAFSGSMPAVWDDARWWVIVSLIGVLLVVPRVRPWLVRREMDHRSRTRS